MNRGLFGISNEKTDVLEGSQAARPGIILGNTFIGYQAGASIQVPQPVAFAPSAGFNTFVGYQSGQSDTTGDKSVMCGYQAGQANTTGQTNTYIGYQAGLNCTTASLNVHIGASAGNAANGGSNVLIGVSAGFNLTGNTNVFVGRDAGFSAAGTNNNVMVGYQAGYTASPGNATTSGTRQTLVGFDAGQNSATQRNDVVALGYQALVNGNNAIAIGSGVLAGAAGTVAIGMDSGGTSASSTVANEIKLGTANHTVSLAALKFNASANESTGAGSAALGANCPAVTVTAPFTWEKVTTSDGSTGFIPVWK